MGYGVWIWGMGYGKMLAAPAFPLKWITIIIFHMQIFAVLPEQVASQSHE